MYLKMIFSVILGCILQISFAFANTPTIHLSTDASQVTAGKSFELKLQVTGLNELPSITIPGVDHFQTLSRMQGQNISIQDGKVSSAYSVTYILTPREKPGKYMLGPVTVVVGGKKYISETVGIQVQEGKWQPNIPQTSDTTQDSGTISQDDAREDILVDGNTIATLGQYEWILLLAVFLGLILLVYKNIASIESIISHPQTSEIIPIRSQEYLVDKDIFLQNPDEYARRFFAHIYLTDMTGISWEQIIAREENMKKNSHIRGFTDMLHAYVYGHKTTLGDTLYEKYLFIISLY